MTDCLLLDNAGERPTREARRESRAGEGLADGLTLSAMLTAIALMLGGCASLDGVAIAQPTTIRPQPTPALPAADGAIFHAANYQPLMEDRRARNVGDILTININEKLVASKTAASNTTRKGGNSFTVPTVAGLPGKSFHGAALSANSDSTFEGKGDSAANNVFTGTISVTVIEVLPNGNLKVAGEKQIGINQGSEYVRLSGVVNPTTIVAGNVVSSTQIADARLEYRGRGYIDEAQTMGWLQRVFLSVLPF